MWRPLTSRTSSTQSGCTRSMVDVKTAPQCSETAPVRRPCTFTPLNFVVTARSEDLTLTCVLTCAEDCEENVNLTWSAANQEGWRSTSSTRVNNTLTMVLLLPAWPNSSDEMRCSVYNEGSLVASRKWHSDTCRFAFLFYSWLCMRHISVEIKRFESAQFCRNSPGWASRCVQLQEDFTCTRRGSKTRMQVSGRGITHPN